MTRLATALLFVASVASAQERRTDRWLTNPVDDPTFHSYLQFFTYSDRLPFDAVIGERLARDGVTREHVTLTSTPGVRVTAYVYRSVDTRPGRERGGIVFLHGGAASGKDTRGYDAMSAFLARDGWVVIAPDLLHYGERGTNVLTTYTNEEKAARLYNEPATYLEFVTQTVKDVSRLYDYLARERNVDSTRISLVGHSRGAVLSSIAGAAERRFMGIVLMHGGHFGQMVHEHRAAACPANYIGRISPRPLLIINTATDSYFEPESQIRPWIRLAKEPVIVRWVNGPHGFLGDEDRAFLLQWLRELPALRP